MRGSRVLAGISLSVMLCIPVGWAETVTDAEIAQGNMGPLKEALRQRGWRVEEDKNGDLLVYPMAGQSTTKGAQNSQTQNADDKSTTIDAANLDQLESTLQGKGWEVKRNAAGDVLLYPKIFLREPVAPAVDSTSPSAASEATVPAQSGSVDQTIQLHELDRLEAEMKKKGWRADRNDAGDLLLYPVEGNSDDVAGKGIEIKAVSLSDCAAAGGSGLAVAGIDLPVSSNDEAESIARAWVAAKGKEGWVIGKIRKINALYLVSLVDASPKHGLHAQLVIHSSDGRVVSIP